MSTFPLPGANWTYLHAMTLKDSTGAAGFALENATPDILTWDVPDDGRLHRFQIMATMIIASTETGGRVDVTLTAPDGTIVSIEVCPNGQSPGFNYSQLTYLVTCKAGSTVTLHQSSALTAGAATLWAEIWAL